MNRETDALSVLVGELFRREATGRGVVALELAQEMVAALLESGARGQDDLTVSDVKLDFFPDAAMFTCRVRIKGKAFPPRLPVDTGVELGVRDITHSEAGASGSLLFRVEKPLRFSSGLADLLSAALGKLSRRLPVSIDALRHKDSLVTVDFAALVAALRPDLEAHARKVKLYGLKVSLANIRLQVGFVRS